MNKRVGIYAVLDKHKDLTKRMNEDARYNISSKLKEADDEELNLDNMDTADDGIEGGLGMDDTADQGAPDGAMPTDQPAEDDDALDLDALADDGGEDQPPMDDTSGAPQGGLDTAPPADLGGEQPPMDMGADMGSTEPTEEIDVTDFIEKGTELTTKVDGQVQAMSDQINSLTQKLASMDQLIGKIQQVEDEIHAMKPPKPIETLKLRSLDSYPYNQGIDDYWKQKEIEIEKLRDFNRVGEKNEYVLTNDDVNNYSDIAIKDSLSPTNPQQSSQFPGPKTNQQQPSRFNNVQS
jgi:hypothetical protein